MKKHPNFGVLFLLFYPLFLPLSLFATTMFVLRFAAKIVNKYFYEIYCRIRKKCIFAEIGRMAYCRNLNS